MFAGRPLRSAVGALGAVLALATPAGAQPALSLRAEADRAGLHLGAAVEADHLEDPAYRRLLDRQVNTLTFENDAKWESLRPAPGRYDFSDADRVAEFALRNGMTVRGHALVWHIQNPDWFDQLDPTRAEAIALLRDHITTVVRHFDRKYPGLVTEWDVVNEAIDDEGLLRNTVWRTWIGENYLDLAFRFAREAAGPGVRLFYNDYLDLGMVVGGERLGDFDEPEEVPRPAPGATGSLPCEAVVKCTAVKRLVRGMMRRRVPLDGVGFQAHLSGPLPSDYRALTTWVGRLGLRWAITELDVPVVAESGRDGAKHQAKHFGRVAAACLDDRACDTLVTWGLSDRHTWWDDLSGGALPKALHFDENLEPRPAAEALRRSLAAAPRAFRCERSAATRTACQLLDLVGRGPPRPPLSEAAAAVSGRGPAGG